MSIDVPLKDVLSFLINKGYNGMAFQFIAQYDEPIRSQGMAILADCLGKHQELQSAKAKQSQQVHEADVANFRNKIKNWDEVQLIEWYGENGPSSSPFSLLGGEMDDYVQAVYHELFQTNKTNPAEHSAIKTIIENQINTRYS